MDRAAGRPSRAKSTKGVRCVLRKIPSSRPRIPSEPLHEGALPPLQRGASAFLLGGDAALGPMAPPLPGRALPRSWWGHRGEEAGAGRLP